MNIKSKTCIGIRTHRWGKGEETIYNQLLQYFSAENIFVVVDEIYKESIPVPNYINKISLSDNYLKLNGILSTHTTQRGLGWLCGDYFYYAMNDAVNAEYYWLIEPDVGFTFEDVSDFFRTFENNNKDALLSSYYKAPQNWMWKKSAELINKQAYKSFFPLTRLSKASILACKEARQDLTVRLGRGEYPIELYPNDEALVATVVGNKKELSISNFKEYFPHSFKYFTYMQSISIIPSANNILPKNQVIHPTRNFNEFCYMINDNLNKYYLNNNTNDFFNKFIFDPKDKETIINNIKEVVAQEIYSKLEQSVKITNYKIALDKILEEYPHLLPNSHIWIWKQNTLVCDVTLSNNSIFTLEFIFIDKNVKCNIFSRKGKIKIDDAFLKNNSYRRTENNKIEIFNVIADDSSFIQKGVRIFYDVIKILPWKNDNGIDDSIQTQEEDSHFNKLHKRENQTLANQDSNINFQKGLRSGLTNITERHIPWVKNWVWNNNVLVFETTTPFGQVAFDVVNAQDYIHLNISVRDINQFKVFAEKMLAKDYRLKILSNNKGFSIGRKSKKDFKSFEDAARYFGRLILEWYHIL